MRLLSIAIALCCVGLALSMLLKLHVNALRVQKHWHTYAWALIHASNARHIQQAFHPDAQRAWEAQVHATLPDPRIDVAWQPHGAIRLCWEEKQCWQSE